MTIFLIISGIVVVLAMMFAFFHMGREIGTEDGIRMAQSNEFCDDPRLNYLKRARNEAAVNMALDAVTEVMVVPEELKKSIKRHLEQKFNNRK